MNGLVVKQHALWRFRQRLGIAARRTDEWVTQRMLGMLSGRQYLYRDYWYACGLVFVICSDCVVTLFKPNSRRNPRVVAAIHRLFQGS